MRPIPRRLFVWILALALAAASFARIASADPRTEGVAKAALKKAEGDFVAHNFGTAAARLDRALKTCGAKTCVPATRAALLRDLGVMAFFKGDKDRASRYFADAVKQYSDVAMNPAYDAQDVRRAFAIAKSGGAAESGGDQPSGDFAHSPPARSSDCPPDFPGCSKKGGSAGKDGEDGGAGEEEEKVAKNDAKQEVSLKHIWIGVAGSIDLQSLPAGQNLCRLDPNTALPTNSANIYCTNPDGSDFPARTLPYGPAQNNALIPGSAGRSDGGLHRGDVRLMLTFDYALTANTLVGARVGVTLYKYPGQAAYNDGRAWSLANGRMYLDARGSYLFGQDAIHKIIAPMVFAGLGAASFDTSVSAGIALQNGQTPESGTVNLWQTNGPFFLLAGAGIHVAMTESLAGVLALRVNGSFGANGFVPTLGPEAAMQLGF